MTNDPLPLWCTGEGTIIPGVFGGIAVRGADRAAEQCLEKFLLNHRSVSVPRLMPYV
jgi:hypothetical protein